MHASYFPDCESHLVRPPPRKVCPGEKRELIPASAVAIAILFHILFATSTFVTLRHYTPSWFFFYLMSNRPLAFLLFTLSNLGTLIQPRKRNPLSFSLSFSKAGPLSLSFTIIY